MLLHPFIHIRTSFGASHANQTPHARAFGSHVRSLVRFAAAARSGSGVTVFGGRHPLLGDLVMKHGGHKDLVELVSLARIEREMGARGERRIVDCLLQSREEGGPDGETARTDRVGASDGADPGPGAADVDDAKRKKGAFDLPVDLTAIAHVPADVMRKMQSQNVLETMESMRRRISMIGRNAPPDRLGPKNGRMMSEAGGSEGTDVADTERELRVQAIRHAVDDMKSRIPSFRMIYISPMHLRERKEELRHCSFRPTRGVSSGGAADSLREVRNEEEEDPARRSSSESMSSSNDLKPAVPPANDGQERPVRRLSSVMRKGRQINLFGASDAQESSICVRPDSVDLCFGGNYRHWGTPDAGNCNEENDCPPRTDGADGYASLMEFAKHLEHAQRDNDWKVTLAQQTIGQCTIDGVSRSAPTASSLLAQGKLHGPLLQHLIDSQIQVIRNLQLLTMPEEANVVDQVRAEYDGIISRQKKDNRIISAEEVSKCANDFVGKAIHKNFHPRTGRLVMLRQFGVDLRRGKIHLKPKEVVPAKHLETLFYETWERAGVDVEGCRPGGRMTMAMQETFDIMFHADPETAEESSSDGRDLPHHPVFAMGLDQWQSLLELALSLDHPNATERVWTCGLTDGGLHNMFLNEDQMWLFDLGEPSLVPIPAFLTKFLMSFFHTLGMEEDEHGDWVVRFEQDDVGKLRLTQRTREMLPGVMEAFNAAMDRLVGELFGSEVGVRVLLLRYVATQLVSDAAFCVERWRTKGGGDELRSEHQYFLEKWLWRALWDMYASEEIRRRYLTRALFRRQLECRNLSSKGPGAHLGSLVE